MNIDRNYKAALNCYVKAAAVDSGSMKGYDLDY